MNIFHKSVRSKGQDALQWAFVSILLALLFVIFAVNPLQQSLDETVRTNDRISMQELVSAINIAQTAPDQSTYKTFFASRGRDACTIALKSGLLKATFTTQGKQTIVFGAYLVTKVPVAAGGPIDCSPRREITITKAGGRVVIA